MSWVRIWVHLVFSTKNRKPLLQTKEIRYEVFNHMKENAKEKDIWLDSVNGILITFIAWFHLVRSSPLAKFPVNKRRIFFLDQ